MLITSLISNPFIPKGLLSEDHKGEKVTSRNSSPMELSAYSGLPA